MKRNSIYFLYMVWIVVFFTVLFFGAKQSFQVTQDTNMKFVSFFHEKNDKKNDNFPLSKEIELNAKYALLMDANSRRVLYEKNGNTQVAMASTTKIMTLLVALENGNLDDYVEVSEYAQSMPKVHLGMKQGEKYRLRDLLYSLMLESHNDSAVAIAEHIGGTVSQFAAMMNRKAKELGAYHTNFVTPNGLDHEQHYSTAYDMALIASYAIENPSFLHIIQQKEYSFTEKEKKQSFHVYNKDRFLASYQGALGIKTGYTSKAGYCFVGAVEWDDKKFVSVVLASGWPPNKNMKWNDTKKLMDYGIENYNKKILLDNKTAFSEISVKNSIEKNPVIPYIAEEVSGLVSDKDVINFEVDLPEELCAPIKKNQRIGHIQIFINDQLYKDIPIYTDSEHHKLTFFYLFQKIANQYFLGLPV